MVDWDVKPQHKQTNNSVLYYRYHEIPSLSLDYGGQATRILNILCQSAQTGCYRKATFSAFLRGFNIRNVPF